MLIRIRIESDGKGGSLFTGCTGVLSRENGVVELPF